MKTIEIDTNELERLRAEQPELMEMRAAVARLRPLKKTEKTELEHEVERLGNQVKVATNGREREAEWIVQHRIARLTQTAADTLHQAIQEYIAQQGRYPASLEPFRGALAEEFRHPSYQRLMESDDLKSLHANRVEVDLEDFELLPPPSNFEPNKELSEPFLILREKQPRKIMDGSWERIYGVSGQEWPEVVTLEDGDFESWEKEFRAR